MQATAAALLPYLMKAMGQVDSSSEEGSGDENMDIMVCEIDSDQVDENHQLLAPPPFLTPELGPDIQEAEGMAETAAAEAYHALEYDWRMVFDIKKDAMKQSRAKAGVILDGFSNASDWGVTRIDVLLDSGAESTPEAEPTCTCCTGHLLGQAAPGPNNQSDVHEHTMMLAPDGHSANFVGDRINGASNATLDSGASSAFSGFREDFGPRARINPNAKPVSLADVRRDHNKLEESIPTAFLDEDDNIVHVEVV